MLPGGWAHDVTVRVRDGVIAAIDVGEKPPSTADRHGLGLPGLSNVHSHAFQRAMAGLAETGGRNSDSFWTWRDLMYRFVERMTPEDLRAVAALAYCEMLEAGFTRVGEFHYLHHDPSGTPYSDIAEMSAAIVAAADESGIGLTLLPVLYSHAGFGARPPEPSQKRFILDVDGYTRLLEGAEGCAADLPDAVVGMAPHSLRAVAPEQLQIIAPLSQGRPIHIHVAEQAKEVEDCLAWCGRRPVDWLLDTCPPSAPMAQI